MLAAADAGADWYERFAQAIRDPLNSHFPCHPFSRVDMDRCTETSPEFVALYEARTSTGVKGPDRVKEADGTSLPHFARRLWFQVLAACWRRRAPRQLWPQTGAAMQPLGDTFIALLP